MASSSAKASRGSSLRGTLAASRRLPLETTNCARKEWKEEQREDTPVERRQLQRSPKSCAKSRGTQGAACVEWGRAWVRLVNVPRWQTGPTRGAARQSSHVVQPCSNRQETDGAAAAVVLVALRGSDNSAGQHEGARDDNARLFLSYREKKYDNNNNRCTNKKERAKTTVGAQRVCVCVEGSGGGEDFDAKFVRGREWVNDRFGPEMSPYKK
jgi:hypothetical protein